ncbi:unnamed protein product [Brassica oleracea var. botrytis]
MALVESVNVFDDVVSTRSELLTWEGSEKQKVQYLEWPLRWSWVVWSKSVTGENQRIMFT